MIGSVLLVSSDRALAEETVLSSGVADASGAQGPRWRRVDFTVPRTGPSTLRLSWTGTADLRFTVFNSATGQKPGAANGPAARCIRVTYNGSLTATVRLYRGSVTNGDDFQLVPQTIVPTEELRGRAEDLRRGTLLPGSTPVAAPLLGPAGIAPLPPTSPPQAVPEFRMPQ